MQPPLLALYQELRADLESCLSLPSPGIGELASYTPLDPLEFGCIAQLKAVWSKYEDNDVPFAIGEKAKEEQAISDFLECNESCKTWNGLTDSRLASEMRNVIDEILIPLPLPSTEGRLRAIGKTYEIPRSESSFNLGELSELMRTGPGKSLGASGDTIYHKLVDGPLTASNNALYTYYRALSDPTSLDCEVIRDGAFGHSVVEYSKFFTVPKSWKAKRGAATEPSLNMMFQLGLGRMIERRLKAFGLDLTRQSDINKVLAKRAWRSDLATLDLSNASNRVPVKLLELLPCEWRSYIMLFRSSAIRIDGEVVDMHILSTMGNGFTFPLETLFFLAVVLAVARISGTKVSLGPNGNIGVFGDDIIVPKSMSKRVIAALEAINGQVNSDKSFTSGPFYESCGGDYLKGVDVRPVHITSLRGDADIYSALNRLGRWSAKLNVSIPRTTKYLVSLLKGPVEPVPPYEADIAGLHLPLSLARSFSRFDEQNRGPFKRRIRALRSPGTLIYTTLDTVKKILFIKDGKLAQNPSGLLLSALFGSVNYLGTSLPRRNKRTLPSKEGYGGQVTLRLMNPQYSTHQRLTPCWGDSLVGSQHDVDPGLTRRWNFCLRRNFVTSETP